MFLIRKLIDYQISPARVNRRPLGGRQKNYWSIKMKIDSDLIKESIIRFIIITGLIIAAGYYLYHNSVFISTHWPFQFLVSGIIVGIAYATFYKNNLSIGITILLIWYIVLTSLVSRNNSWGYILEGVYIGFFSAAVYLYILIIRKYIIENILVRFIISSILFGVINSLIIVFLSLLSQAIFVDMSKIIKPMILNLQIGAGIGLMLGIGIQLSDSFIKSILVKNNSTT